MRDSARGRHARQINAVPFSGGGGAGQPPIGSSVSRRRAGPGFKPDPCRLDAASHERGLELRIALAVLVVLLLGLQYRLWFADGGLVEVWRLREQIAAQRAENARLRERNQALAAEVRDLQRGLEAVEAIARSELGMVGEDETFYRIVRPEPDPAEPGNAPAHAIEGGAE